MKWIDMHCDTLSELMNLRKAKGRRAELNGKETEMPERAREPGLWENPLCVDGKRLRDAGAEAQFFACFVNVPDGNWNQGYENVLEMLSFASQQEELPLICSREDLKCTEQNGITGMILTVEEGGILNGDLNCLEELYQRGVRLVTLTWNYGNCIGSPNSRKPEVMKAGLTEFGIETVRRMNELGMLIDVSHLSDGGFWDCMKHSRMPVVASHSNARSLCSHPRNLTDEMLHTLGEKGGVAGINFYSAFLTGVSAVSDSGKCSAPDDIARHAAWMIAKSGEDAVALGTDFDGFERESLPAGIAGVQDMYQVWDAMKKRGITPRQIDKIAAGNIKRVIQEVWK